MEAMYMFLGFAMGMAAAGGKRRAIREWTRAEWISVLGATLVALVTIAWVQVDHQREMERAEAVLLELEGRSSESFSEPRG